LKQHTSGIILEFEHELTSLNKSLNNICYTNCVLKNENEKEYQNRCYKNDLDKADKINEFTTVKR